MKILSKDISVIVQGPIYEKITDKVLKSIRTYLPGAEIILSTWKNSDVSGLDFDHIVFSVDVGAGSVDSLGIANNINRQLISTKNGLDFVTNKYCFKLRSDMYFASSEFLKYYEMYSENAFFFKRRILVSDFFTRNPRVIPMPFHISDWFAFGLTEDIISFYKNIPLQDEEENTWFKDYINYNSFFKAMLTRYAPEQYIILSFFKDKYKIKCNDYGDNNLNNIILTERILAENFIVIDSQKCGIIFSKYNPNRFKEYMSLISYRDWKDLYYCYIYQKNLSVYIFKSYVRRIYYFYIRRYVSRLLDYLQIKQMVRKWIGKG